MAPTPHRIAQTSTELKKQHKQNGLRLNERQQKQYQRDFELEQRATRAREAEQRRKAAKKKREEREAKEARARQQIGVGLATQLVGYSHTQAQLKNGMEAFLGLKKKKDEEKRKKDLELTKKLEEIAEEIEKEPWDDDDEFMGVDLPDAKVSFGEQWADDDLDDDTLLEAHNMVMSDPVEELQAVVQPPAPISSLILTPLVVPPPLPKPAATTDDREFTRTHGPINKAIEVVLDKLPESLIELLSHDFSLKIPDWDPSAGLLYKLNPVGLPPHRLRIKVGCIVFLLRDLNTSSQLSKSQHLRVLRCENDRLECLVLDGQLQGTKTFLTRVSFIAKYKNLDQHPFQRTQFPIRVAVDYKPSSIPRDTPQSGFKLPSIPGRVPIVGLSRKWTPPVVKAKPSANNNPGFKLPGLPASKSSSSVTVKHISVAKQPQSIPLLPTDCWDDFLESSTQISRELASEPTPKHEESAKFSAIASSSIVDSLPPISTQDFDFSLDDLDEEPQKEEASCGAVPKTHITSGTFSAPLQAHSTNLQPLQKPTSPLLPLESAKPLATSTNANNIPTPNRFPPRPSATANSSRPLTSSKKIAGKCLNPGPFASGLEVELAKLRASQLPKSMSGPNAKRKAAPTPSKTLATSAKRQCAPLSHSVVLKASAVALTPSASFEDFAMSTQEVASFFDDDDDMSFGSPPIAV
jgi:hypothetical protein